MSFENAIAGLGQLQQSFQNIAERRQREKLQLEEQEKHYLVENLPQLELQVRKCYSKYQK